MQNKSGVVNNKNINLNLAIKPKISEEGRGSKEISTNDQTQIHNNINLPNINKNNDNIKFESSLVGFATRSLSKNGTLKLQKMKTNSDNFNTKPDTSSTWNLNAKNPLINVPKKYQFRCKRLNFDYPSVISSNKSKNQSENLQIQQTFHTKSGPIQVNEALNISRVKQSHHINENKLKITDYKLKGIGSPTTEASNFEVWTSNIDDFSSAQNKISPLKISTDEHSELKASIKKFKKELVISKGKRDSFKENKNSSNQSKYCLKLVCIFSNSQSSIIYIVTELMFK